MMEDCNNEQLICARPKNEGEWKFAQENATTSARNLSERLWVA
jgi:hypothetical protein